MTKAAGAKLTVRENVSYAVGSLGREISNNLINVFFMAYLTVVVGLQGWIVGIVFALSKLWDAINDPMMATIVNNTKSRFGRFKPWIAIGAFLNAFSLVGMFAPLNCAIGGKYVFYTVMYVMWSMTFTMVDVPFWSMIPSIAESTDDRNKISSLCKLLGGFGGFIITTVGTMIISRTYGQNPKSYLLLAAVGGGCMALFLSVMLINNKEKIQLPRQQIKFREIFKIFKTNDQLAAYAVSFVLFVTGTTISLIQLVYIFTYEEVIGRLAYEHYGIFTIAACTIQGIAMFFYPWITRKIKRERIYGLTYPLAVAGMAAMFTIFFFLKPGGAGTKILNVVFVALAGSFLMTANGLNQIGSTVMIADVVDYGEYKTGIRSDSVIFSVQTLLTKLAGAIASLLLGIGVSVAKLPQVAYDLVQITDENGVVIKEEFQNVVVGNAAVTPEMMTVLRVFMFLLPIPLVLIGYLVFKKKYTLHGKKYDEMYDELLQIRARNAAAKSRNKAPDASFDAVAESVTLSHKADGDSENDLAAADAACVEDRSAKDFDRGKD